MSLVSFSRLGWTGTWFARGLEDPGGPTVTTKPTKLGTISLRGERSLNARLGGGQWTVDSGMGERVQCELYSCRCHISKLVYYSDAMRCDVM